VALRVQIRPAPPEKARIQTVGVSRAVDEHAAGPKQTLHAPKERERVAQMLDHFGRVDDVEARIAQLHTEHVADQHVGAGRLSSHLRGIRRQLESPRVRISASSQRTQKCTRAAADIQNANVIAGPKSAYLRDDARVLAAASSGT
jgi:hypothetical protein